MQLFVKRSNKQKYICVYVYKEKRENPAWLRFWKARTSVLYPHQEPACSWAQSRCVHMFVEEMNRGVPGARLDELSRSSGVTLS